MFMIKFLNNLVAKQIKWNSLEHLIICCSITEISHFCFAHTTAIWITIGFKCDQKRLCFLLSWKKAHAKTCQHYVIVVSHLIQKSTSKCQAPVSQHFINFTDWYMPMLQYCCVCLCSWQSGILNHTESGCWLFLYLLFKIFILAGF